MIEILTNSNINTMKKILFIVLAMVPSIAINAQDKQEEKKIGIYFSGYVKSDFFYDSRQTYAAREGHFLFWPDAKDPDANEEDINARGSFNFLSVQSRLTGKITGPDAFGAKTSGTIEGDFFAQVNDNINLFRLRHAFIKFNWSTTELLTGQYWNPLFVTDCFPGTVSFNTGTPLQSFARNPQIRLTQSFGDFKVILAALSQRDYASRGELGATSDYLRNSSSPDMHLQVHYSVSNDEAGTGFTAGAGMAYKIIIPRLSSDVIVNDTLIYTYKVDEKVGGLTAIAFMKLKLKPVTIKLQGRYGENIADVLSISGFAVKEVTDNVTGERSYTPLKNITFWGDIHTNGKKIQVGLFGGYMKNLGTKEAMSSTTNPIYGFGYNIESLFRISPRVLWNYNKVRMALELELTAASFGSDHDVNYVPSTTSTVVNLRTLYSVYYFF